jgi:hypothetical protein
MVPMFGTLNMARPHLQVFDNHCIQQPKLYFVIVGSRDGYTNHVCCEQIPSGSQHSLCWLMLSKFTVYVVPNRFAG